MQKLLLLLIAICGLFQCHAHIRHNSPGYTEPQLVEIAIGSSANITCHLNPKHLQLSSQNASDLYFINQQNEQRVPSEDVIVINSTTIVYQLRNATRQSTKYLCKLRELAIMDTKVFVGTAPQPVEHFKCRNYDLEYMLCTFIRPYNTIQPNYELTYQTTSSYYNRAFCFYNQLEYIVCNISSTSYRPSIAYYHFKLNGTNSLGSCVEQFTVNNFDVTVPAAPVKEVSVIEKTTNRLEIGWSQSRVDYIAQIHLQWEILLHPVGFPVRNLSTSAKIIKLYKKGWRLLLDDLPYAYYTYDLTIRARVNSSSRDADLWSEPFEYRFRTAARRPDRPPRTAFGGYYVDSSETQVHLYWEQLQVQEYNGENFTYVISEVRENGANISLAPKHLELNSAVFKWNKSAYYEFVIRSRNNVSVSEQASTIKVYPLYDFSANYTPRTIHNIFYETNRTYTLTWEQPAVLDGLQGYTVYWCHTKRALQHECNATNSIHFRNLARDARNFTTEPHHETLNLAVSANYDNYTTGLHWSACTQNANHDLIQMLPEAEPNGATAIKLQWSPESICPSILIGYNLSYCEVDMHSVANKNATCLGKEHNRLIDRNERKLIIENLKPFTCYNISMYMYSPLRAGKRSDAIVQCTWEAAPTAPRKVQFENVTSNSARISWLPPSQPNGEIRQYYIKYNEHKVAIVAQRPINDMLNTRIYYTLQNLLSYTSYKVYVTAETTSESPVSNDVHFTTLMSYPSMPGINSPERSGNYTKIQWSKPEVPAGRVDFYEIAVTQYRRNEVLKRRISIVLGSTECTLQVPDCIDNDYKTTFEVRAVNAQHLSANDSSLHEALPSNANNADAMYYEGSDELICHGESAYNQMVQQMQKQSYFNSIQYHLYRSNWQHGTIISCSNPRIPYGLLVIPVALAALYFAFTYISKLLNKMRNIKCTLPSGLEEYSKKDGNASITPAFVAPTLTMSEFALSTQTSREECHNFYHNEEHHLLESLGNDSGYLGDMIGGGSGAAAIATHVALRTQSESSINDSLSSESNLESINALNGAEKAVETVAPLTIAADTATIMPQQIKPANAMQTQVLSMQNGYVTPANMLLNWQPAKTTTASTTCLDKTTDNNVINMDINSDESPPQTQPQHQLTAASSGYVSVESIGDQQNNAPTNTKTNGGYVQPAHLQAMLAGGYVTPRELTAFGQTQPI